MKKYFSKWRIFVSSQKYDRWCEEHEEEINEIVYAQKNLEPIYWCWKCKHSECEEHTKK
jgi:hypothetical protein